MKINEVHFFKIWMGSGSGSNTKVKLMASSDLLVFAMMIWIDYVLVFGDSSYNSMGQS